MKPGIAMVVVMVVVVIVVVIMIATSLTDRLVSGELILDMINTLALV